MTDDQLSTRDALERQREDAARWARSVGLDPARMVDDTLTFTQQGGPVVAEWVNIGPAAVGEALPREQLGLPEPWTEEQEQLMRHWRRYRLTLTPDEFGNWRASTLH